MSTAIGSFWRPPSSGEGSAPAERLHLSARRWDQGLARHAHRGARAPSSALLLAPLPASRRSRAQALGRDGPGAARHQHGVARGARAQSRLLARASPRAVVGAGAHGHLASPRARHPVSLWRWQPRRPTRPQESGGAARAHQPAASLVLWPALRPGEGGMGARAPPRGLAAHAAQAPHG